MNWKIILSASLAFSILLLSTTVSANTGQFSKQKYLKGKAVYGAYCVLCHGKKANGQGRMAAHYRKIEARQPSNFTVRFFQFRPVEYLTKIILEGGEVNKLSKYMPPFKDELTDTQIDEVVYFIKSVSKFSYGEIKSEDTK